MQRKASLVIMGLLHWWQVEDGAGFTELKRWPFRFFFSFSLGSLSFPWAFSFSCRELETQREYHKFSKSKHYGTVYAFRTVSNQGLTNRSHTSIVLSQSREIWVICAKMYWSLTAVKNPFTIFLYFLSRSLIHKKKHNYDKRLQYINITTDTIHWTGQ